MVVGVTGHRLERIKNKKEEITNWLNEQLINLRACYDNVVLLDGMARGVDQIAAIAAIKNGVGVKCYFPYKHKLSNIEKYIADNAIEVRYECEKFQNACYFKRDRCIVDDCDLLMVVWDGKPWGGTYLTYQYAIEEGKDVLIYPWVQINEDWDAVQEGYNDRPQDQDNQGEEWD